jgi:nucleotide-binding universal stress UspA family protein
MAAVDCDPDELVMCGSGTAGPLRRVFLGDTAQKILRTTPAPVLVVPRHAESDLDTTRAIPTVSG